MNSPFPHAAGFAVESQIAQSPGRHERVLDEAAKQLNSKGVLLTSLAEIAEKLGVSRSAMYYYVADRRDLVFQCYQRAAQITARHLAEATRTPGTADNVLRTFIAHMLDPNEPEIAARAEIAMMDATQRDTIQGLHDAIVARIARLLEIGQSEGVFRQCDVDINARIILSVVTWAPLAAPWARAIGPVGNSRLLAATIATLLEGLSSKAQLPEFSPLDMSTLAPPNVRAFDREAALHAKREALLRVASRLFNRKGIDSTSLEEIAAQVGATKRTVHHHLGSKADLVIGCFERAFRIFFYIRDRMNTYEGSRLEALAAAMHALSLAYPSEELTPLSPLVGFGALSAEGQAKIESYSEELGQSYHTVIRRGIEDGSVVDIDVEARALMLPGLISWLVKDDVPTDPIRREHIAREVANVVAVGLRTLSA
ncbi:MAG TPA: TetR/AcrR family transcriptional regulator, partial [Steroidobacteraceae bacterium]|nr:TetR/AcrR family transcriptional regulator [Steroidobacteraceae bacterium]